MTAPATLTARAAPEYGPDWRYIEIDCDHGTTQGAYAPGPDPSVGDAEIVRVMLLRHYLTEGCRCTRRLRKRYGVTP
jgi:hypothetical protein